MEFSHKCLKCGVEYKDADPEPYYCEACDKERKEIAKKVDEKLVGIGNRPVESGMAMYERLRKGRPFINARDIGL